MERQKAQGLCVGLSRCKSSLPFYCQVLDMFMPMLYHGYVSKVNIIDCVKI